MLKIIVGIIAMVILLAGNWKILEKAGRPGWHALVPVLNVYEIYEICWDGGYGIMSLLLTFGISILSVSVKTPVVLIIPMLLTAVIYLAFSIKLAESFDRSFLMGVLLFFCPVLGRVILGFGDARYIGKEDETYTMFMDYPFF